MTAACSQIGLIRMKSGFIRPQIGPVRTLGRAVKRKGV